MRQATVNAAVQVLTVISFCDCSSQGASMLTVIQVETLESTRPDNQADKRAVRWCGYEQVSVWVRKWVLLAIDMGDDEVKVSDSALQTTSSSCSMVVVGLEF